MYVGEVRSCGSAGGGCIKYWAVSSPSALRRPIC